MIEISISREATVAVYHKNVILAEIDGYYLKFNKQLARISKCYGEICDGIVQYLPGIRTALEGT